MKNCCSGDGKKYSVEKQIIANFSYYIKTKMLELIEKLALRSMNYINGGND